MHPARRSTLAALAGSLAAAAVPAALAQPADAYPAKPIRFIVPFPPAGPSDILARLVAQHLGARLGQTVVVDNRAGAAGAIGMEQAARSPADGYTVVLGGLPVQVLNPALYSKLSYDPVREFVPVALLARVPYVLVVNPSLPAANVPELVRLLKANPGKYNYGTPGSGNTSHIAAEMFKRAAGVDVAHVPYKGDAPALQDLIGGQVQLVFTLPVSVLPHVQAGRVKAIGTAAPQRSQVMPDLPTFEEQGLKGVQAETWFSMLAPAGTPPEVVARLNAEIAQVMRQPDVRERLLSLGAAPGSGSPAEVAAFVQAERVKWTPLVKASGATVD